MIVDFDQGIDEDILKTFYKGEFWSRKKLKIIIIINKALSRYGLVKEIYFVKNGILDISIMYSSRK